MKLNFVKKKFINRKESIQYKLCDSLTGDWTNEKQDQRALKKGQSSNQISQIIPKGTHSGSPEKSMKNNPSTQQLKISNS